MDMRQIMLQVNTVHNSRDFKEIIKSSEADALHRKTEIQKGEGQKHERVQRAEVTTLQRTP